MVFKFSHVFCSSYPRSDVDDNDDDGKLIMTICSTTWEEATEKDYLLVACKLHKTL